MTVRCGVEVLREARATGTAVPGFVAYNLETAQAIAQAAEETQRPVLLMAGAGAFAHAGREALAGLALQVAAAADVDIGVHLDHARTVEEVTACIDLGYTSVMIDGSHLPFVENVAMTRQVVEHARARGVWVEAELVGVAGDEDASSGASAGALTDPVVAATFVETTGVDALAVSIGNVHGRTTVPPQLDLTRLEQIRDAVDVPLVLHGASGLSPATLRACLARGVAKVNVNTELRRAYLLAFEAALPSALARDDLATPLAASRDAVAAKTVEIIELLGRGS